MLIGQKGIKYGLTVPASKNKSATAKPAPKLAAFGDDDSDGEHEAVPQQLARQAASKRSNTKVLACSFAHALAHLHNSDAAVSQVLQYMAVLCAHVACA